MENKERGEGFLNQVGGTWGETEKILDRWVEIIPNLWFRTFSVIPYRDVIRTA